MPLKTLKQPDLNNVVTDGFATTKMTTTGTHYAMILEFLDNTGAAVPVADIISEIGAITAEINGVAILDRVTPDFLFKRELFFGAAHGVENQAGIINHDWTWTNLDVASQRAKYAIGTEGEAANGGVGDFSVEVECGTLVKVAKIKCYAVVSSEKRKIGTHIRIGRFTDNFAGTGDFEITKLPKDGGKTAYKALWFGEGSGAIADMTLQVNDTIVKQQVSAAINSRELKGAGRTPQTGFYVLDFNTLNTDGDYLTMAGVDDFRQTINFSTQPDSFNIYAERVYGLSTTNVAAS